MSRIRSVHPGIWTDEAFVSLSPYARLLFIGIWNECDDAGSFEWSPLKLKMRLLPADNVDATSLMEELVTNNAVIKYEVAGKAYGAVRNFCQYQRPKKPNSTYPQTDEVRKWVNTEARSVRDGSEPVGNQLPIETETSRQMEDGGGRREIPRETSSLGVARVRASRLPADFSFPTDWVDWAMKDRCWDKDEVAEECATFVDYWHAKSGKDAAKLDWEATWRNWCRNSRRSNGFAGVRVRQREPVIGI